MSSGVVILITNYKRPENIPRCIRAWKKQSVQAERIVIVDNAPLPLNRDGQYTSERYPKNGGDMEDGKGFSCWVDADDWWRVTENLGCPCYFGPAAAYFQYKYILHADDDFLPGTRAIETLLETAEVLDGCFATIGQSGRVFSTNPKKARYLKGNCRQSDEPEMCDLTCRVQFFKQRWLTHVFDFRRDIAAEFGEEGVNLASIHDDFLVACGIQRGSGNPSYVIPEADSERQLIKENLPEPEATWKRKGHFAERERMIEIAEAVGWKSLVGVTA